MADDRELVARALQGEEAAYRALVERHKRGLFSLIVRLVGDREEAEDLAQEVFVRAFRNLKRFDPGYSFSSWLLKIGQNLSIDTLRARKPPAEPFHERGEEGPPLQISDEVESPEKRAERLETREILGRAVAQLPPHYRAVIHLFHVQEKSYPEIAEILDLPMGTVKTHLYRARQALRELLAGTDLSPP